MPNAVDGISPAETRTIEDALPEMLDQALAKFQRVGVERILQLAEEMVRARMEQSPSGHLVPGPSQNN